MRTATSLLSDQTQIQVRWLMTTKFIYLLMHYPPYIYNLVTLFFYNSFVLYLYYNFYLNYIL